MPSVRPLHIPNIITGTMPGPGNYGRSASQNYYNLAEQVKDELHRTHDKSLVDRFVQTTIRYTPEGTIGQHHVNDDAVRNALGYAQEEIRYFDRDGDHGLSQTELVRMFMQPFLAKIAQLQTTVLNGNPPISDEQRQQAQLEVAMLKTKGDVVATTTAANLFQSVDVRDDNGQSDGKLTADELAAKTLFDDAALQMFKTHQVSYKQAIAEKQANEGFDSSFQDLKNSVNLIESRQHSQPLVQDGQITSGEAEIAELLTLVPIPTNQIISNLHHELGLKARVVAN